MWTISICGFVLNSLLRLRMVFKREVRVRKLDFGFIIGQRKGDTVLIRVIKVKVMKDMLTPSCKVIKTTKTKKTKEILTVRPLS